MKWCCRIRTLPDASRSGKPSGNPSLSPDGPVLPGALCPGSSNVPRAIGTAAHSSLAQILGKTGTNFGKISKRPRQMFAKMALRVIRLVRADCFHDQPVMAHDVLRLAGRGQMEPAQAVDMTAAAAHQIPEFLVAGRGIKLSMEVVVGAHELLEIPRLGEFLLSRDGGVQLVHQPLGMFERQALDDFQFQ